MSGDDIRARMQKQLARPAQESAPFRSAPSPFERRLTLDLTATDHRALKLAAVEADSSMADLLRALISLWQADAGLAQRVRQLL